MVGVQRAWNGSATVATTSLSDRSRISFSNFKAIITVKKVLVTLAALLAIAMSSTANAAWLVNGVWYSNVCRSVADPRWYFIYPVDRAQPLGTACAFYIGTEYTVGFVADH